MLERHLGKRQRRAVCGPPGHFLAFTRLPGGSQRDGSLLRLFLLLVAVFPARPRASQTGADSQMSDSPSVL